MQPWGKYKPVTRFAQFVDVAEPIAMFRSFADVVMPADLRDYAKVPEISGGKRQIITAPTSAASKAVSPVSWESLQIQSTTETL